MATEDRPTGSYRALFVDYGGVMTTSMTVSFAAFCAATGVDPSRLKDVLAAAYATAGDAGVSSGDVHDLVRGVETGRLDSEEFDRDLAAALSVGLPDPVPAAGLTSRLFAELRPDERMRGAVRIARERGLVTGLISNGLSIAAVAHATVPLPGSPWILPVWLAMRMLPTIPASARPANIEKYR